MINFLLGAPGGGKSYEAVVFHILPALKAGRLVITNLPLNVPFIYSVMPEAIGLIKLVQSTQDNPRPFSTLADYGDTWRREHEDPDQRIGPLYVIDECHKALPRGSTRQDVEEWYAEHRHELADVLLLTQSYGKVSRPIVDLAQLVYRVRYNFALGSSKTYTKKVQDGIRGEVVNTTLRKYDPAYYKFYKSHTKSDGAASELQANDIKPIWQHWSVIGAGIFFVIAVYMAVTGKLNPFPARQEATAKAPATTHSQVQESAGLPPGIKLLGKPSDVLTAATMPQALSHPFYKVQLHLAGYVETESGRYLYTVSASQNGQKVFEMTSRDLLRAGYSLESIAPCALKLTFKEFSDYLTCDSPAVAVQLNGERLDSNTVSSSPPSRPEPIVIGEQEPREEKPYESIFADKKKRS